MSFFNCAIHNKTAKKLLPKINFRADFLGHSLQRIQRTRNSAYPCFVLRKITCFLVYNHGYETFLLRIRVFFSYAVCAIRNGVKTEKTMRKILQKIGFWVVKKLKIMRKKFCANKEEGSVCCFVVNCTIHTCINLCYICSDVFLFTFFFIKFSTRVSTLTIKFF